MKKNNYFGIYKSFGLWAHSEIEDLRASIAECNERELNEVDDEWVAEDANSYLDDERENLDVETGGVIIAFGNLGRWNGRFRGYKIFGSNINSILVSSCDEVEWYADKYNVRGSLHHHDGTDYILYRYVPSREKAEKIGEKIYNGEITDESQFMKATKSIRPFIAKVYGWREFGRLPY